MGLHWPRMRGQRRPFLQHEFYLWSRSLHPISERRIHNRVVQIFNRVSQLSCSKGDRLTYNPTTIVNARSRLIVEVTAEASNGSLRTKSAFVDCSLQSGFRAQSFMGDSFCFYFATNLIPIHLILTNLISTTTMDVETPFQSNAIATKIGCIWFP